MNNFFQKQFDSPQKYDFLSILAIKQFTYNFVGSLFSSIGILFNFLFHEYFFICAFKIKNLNLKPTNNRFYQ